MKTINVTYTHKGWLGLCPIHAGSIGTACPDLKARHWTLDWFLEANAYLFSLIFIAMESVNLDPPGWPIRITGRLDEPYSMGLEIESD
jgi:hypothetical protein